MGRRDPWRWWTASAESRWFPQSAAQAIKDENSEAVMDEGMRSSVRVAVLGVALCSAPVFGDPVGRHQANCHGLPSHAQLKAALDAADRRVVDVLAPQAARGGHAGCSVAGAQSLL